MHNYNIFQSANKIFLLFFIWLGYIIYSPMTSNYITNPDGICIGLVYKPESEGAEMGRMGISRIDALFGKVVSPNLMLITSLVIMGLTIYFLAEIFHIESFWERACLGILMLVMPTISSTFSYYYCMVSYVLAYFFAVYACYITIKNQKTWGLIIGGALIAVQLMLYQAYLSVAIAIVLLYLLYLLFAEVELKKILGGALKFALMGIMGVGIYLVLLKAMKVPLTSSRGFDKMGQIDADNILNLVGQSYRACFDYFWGNKLLNNGWMHRDLFHFILVGWFIGTLVFVWFKKRMYQQVVKTVLGGILILLLPIALEIMVVMAPEVDTYGTTGILLVPAMGLVYMTVIFFRRFLVELFSCGNSKCNKVVQYGCLIVIIPVIWNLALFTAAFENVMWLNYQGTYLLCTKISDRIDEYAYGQEENVKIAIVGNPELGNYPCTYEELRSIVKGTLATKGLIWQGGWLSNVCYRAVFRNYYNIDYQIPTIEEYETIVASDEYELMGLFPSRDSVAYIGDVIVIKLSE